MTEEIIFEREGPVATITFNRPEKANALLIEWPDMINQFFVDMAGKSDVRCILIKANGKHFVAGGDLEQFPDTTTMTAAEKALRFESDVYSWNRMIQSMQRCPQPVVCSVQGAVAGAAVGLVAACDLIVSARSAFYFLAHVLSGMTNDGLATYYLPRQIGVHRTLQLALMGERITAQQAYDWGMVNYLAEDDELTAETNRVVKHLINGPTSAYANIKKLVRSSLDNSLEQQGVLEAQAMVESVQSHDWLEGITAFAEKRKPTFKGS